MRWSPNLPGKPKTRENRKLPKRSPARRQTLSRNRRDRAVMVIHPGGADGGEEADGVAAGEQVSRAEWQKAQFQPPPQ